MKSILLIDDSHQVLDELKRELAVCLEPGEAEIQTWAPEKDGGNPLETFDRKVNEDTIFVVTDYDLTAQGQTGLFGSSIVGWCQARAIPVGDYSRANVSALPREPNLFELRIPKEARTAAEFITRVFHGFKQIHEQLEATTDLLNRRSPAAVLAALLGNPSLESDLSLYGTRLSTTNAAILQLIMPQPESEPESSDSTKRKLLGYLVGHILLNAVLRFPGPILSLRALVAYVGCDESESNVIGKLFEDSQYQGPFSEYERLFWLSKVDEALEPLIEALPQSLSTETHGELHREAIETSLGRKLNRHQCPRCNGKNGGFLCPFTNRTVCQLPDCSVGSNSWIPQGAGLCRIERDYYEEWSPILGM